ncbi:uncharacterized protein TrAtP1_000142 [Trichoderma atroviride]|uniref:uncharacterized protein n=1 Tax=Hypocrea atroviridis TaxID=63577 RepID=UPI003327B543|nr:hypothetical protein TrAtP1_000142 [Trichoderma atroviride]
MPVMACTLLDGAPDEASPGRFLYYVVAANPSFRNGGEHVPVTCSMEGLNRLDFAPQLSTRPRNVSSPAMPAIQTLCATHPSSINLDVHVGGECRVYRGII